MRSRQSLLVEMSLLVDLRLASRGEETGDEERGMEEAGERGRGREETGEVQEGEEEMREVGKT